MTNAAANATTNAANARGTLNEADLVAEFRAVDE